jgi:DNA-binding transcriptional LysR family regulator
MDLRHLKHFLAVAETGGISAAARNLGLTQPALSRQIKALEEEIGAVLLDRGAHSIALTPAGEVLLAEVRKLIRFSDAMVEKVKAAAGGIALRIGYAPSLAGEFLPVAIERFTQCHPRVRVSLFDSSSAEMRAGLSSGKLDLVVATPGVGAQDPIRWETLREYGWQVVMSGNHPLARKKHLTAKDLSGQRLLLYDREHYPDYWDRVTDFFRDHGLQAKVAGEFDGVNSLMAALEGNLGIALLAVSIPIDRDGKGRLTARPLENEPTTITVATGVSSERPQPTHVLAFIEELKTAARDLSR